MRTKTLRFVVQATLDASAFAAAAVIAFSIALATEKIELDNLMPGGSEWHRLQEYALLGGLWVIWYGWFKRAYLNPEPFWTDLHRILSGVSALAILDLALIGLSKEHYSRTWWFLAWAALLILLPLSRQTSRRILCLIGVWKRPTYIFGNDINARDAYSALQSEPAMGFEVRGFISLNSCAIDFAEQAPPTHTWVLGQPCPVDLKGVQCVVALETNQHTLRDQLLRELYQYPTENVHVVPSMRGVPLYGSRTTPFFNHEVMMIHVHNNLASQLHCTVKRVFDVVGALLILLLVSPLMLWVAWRIWGTDGFPIIFTQQRIGKNGRPFKFYKFRSMVRNAEGIIRQWEDSNSPEWQRYVANNFKLDDDPRLLGIGPFIRRTSIDELPQLFNVIKGEMSLVGPRPLMPREVKDYGIDIVLYSETPPGITGLWQVSGRSQTTFQDRVFYDTWYVKNWSLWTDVTILFKTINVVLKRDGAF